MKQAAETSEKTKISIATVNNNRIKESIKESNQKMVEKDKAPEIKVPDNRLSRQSDESTKVEDKKIEKLNAEQKTLTAAPAVDPKTDTRTDTKTDTAKKNFTPTASVVGKAEPVLNNTRRSEEMNSFIGKIHELQIRKKHVVKSAAFLSNKGGVGKTHIASNMSFYMTRLGKKVLLIDLDLGNSDVCNKLGFFCKNTIMDLMHGRQDVDQLIYNTPYGFDIVSGESGNYKLANLTAAQKNRFIKALRRVSGEYDFVIYDLAAGIGGTTIDFALAQDYQIVVTTPQDIIAGYSCIKAAFYRFREVEKALAARNKDYQMQKTFRPFVILNQVPDFATGRALYEKIAHVSRENIRSADEFSLEINLLGIITADQEKIRESELKHFMYSNAYGANKTGQCFHFLSHNLIQYRDPNNMEFTTKFQRFVDLFMKGVEEFKYAQ